MNHIIFYFQISLVYPVLQQSTCTWNKVTMNSALGICQNSSKFSSPPKKTHEALPELGTNQNLWEVPNFEVPVDSKNDARLPQEVISQKISPKKLRPGDLPILRSIQWTWSGYPCKACSPGGPAHCILSVPVSASWRFKAPPLPNLTWSR